MRLWLMVFLLALSAVSLQAREAAPLAPDEASEKRLVAISSELRCLVCNVTALSASRNSVSQILILTTRQPVAEFCRRNDRG